MIINERDEERLDAFLKSFLEFLKSKSEFQYYKNEKNHNPAEFVEKLDGTILPTATEGPLIMDNEFPSFIIDSLQKLLEIMLNEVDSKLFGLAERTLHEYLVTWVFIYSHSEVKVEDKNRLKALLLVGHYKFISEDPKEFDIYYEQRKHYLTDDDISKINSIDSTKVYFDYVWEIAKKIRNSYGNDVFESYLKQVNFREIWSHQSMRVHANPLAINELVNNNDISVRHKLVLAFCARQVLDYFASINRTEVEKLIYQYDKFWNNHKIRPS